jgi:hypothetical protein
VASAERLDPDGDAAFDPAGGGIEASGPAVDREEAAMEQREQTEGGGHVCGKCGAAFETQEELDRHVQAAHAEGDEDQSAKEE